MSTQRVPGWQIAAAADIAWLGANKDDQQRYVDNVYREGNAADRGRTPTGW